MTPQPIWNVENRTHRGSVGRIDPNRHMKVGKRYFWILGLIALALTLVLSRRKAHELTIHLVDKVMRTPLLDADAGGAGVRRSGR